MNKNKLEMQKTVMAVWQAIDKNEDGFVNWTVFRKGLPLKEREEYLNYIKENWFVEERKGSGRRGFLIKPKYLRSGDSKPINKIDKKDPLNNKRWLETTMAAKFLNINPSSLRTNLAKKIKNKKSKVKDGRKLRFWLVSDLVSYKQNRNTNRLRGIQAIKVNESKPEKLVVHPALNEILDVIDMWKLDFSEGNLIRYIIKSKIEPDNKLENLQKALFYLKRIIHNAE